MPSLAELQRKFAEIVSARDLEFEAYRSLFVDEKSSPVSLETRLGIYHYAYFARILESLASDFSNFRKDIGEERFEELAREYLDRYPSHYPGLGEVGKDFARFLAETYPQNPEWEDQVKIEWAQCLASWSESAEPTNFAQLLSLAPDEQMKQRLLLAPSFQLTQTRQRGLQAYFKVRGEIKCEELTPSMGELLSKIQAGKSLGELIGLFEQDAELASSGMAWISKFVSIGLITGFGAS